MRIVRGLRNLEPGLEKPVVTLGNFDGVHIGHQTIFKKVIQRVREVGGTAVVYTFEPHPLKILAPDSGFSLLTTFKKKMELIAARGIDVTILADFDRAFAAMHPRDFARKLKEGLGMETVFVGHDYSFGKGKLGTIDYLRKMGAELGFGVEVVEPVMVDGTRVSSTCVRDYLLEGEIGEATKRLGRYYSIAGRVVSGYMRGRAIGFPTANLETPYEVIPAVGVYAVFARVGPGEWHEGVLNIGFNPTFNRDDFIVEVHLLDMEGELYGTEVEVFFVERLRDEKAFGSVEELKDQIDTDIKWARRILAEARDSGLISEFI
ncbi:MAG: bifunctional riboflavin kinase/FAD synthetase [Candidatus Nitrospinota bacterium M3_3B_026]